MLSLVAGGGDKEDAGADDEAAEVRERELVLVPEAEEIRGYEQHHGLGSLESGRMAAEVMVTTVRRGRTKKVVATTRATVKRSRRRSQ